MNALPKDISAVSGIEANDLCMSSQVLKPLDYDTSKLINTIWKQQPLQTPCILDVSIILNG